jgi:hypothetical protein
MILSNEELDILIDKFLDDFVANQIKRDPRWNYPETIDLPLKKDIV